MPGLKITNHIAYTCGSWWLDYGKLIVYCILPVKSVTRSWLHIVYWDGSMISFLLPSASVSGNVPIIVKPYSFQYREGRDLIQHIFKLPTQGLKNLWSNPHLASYNDVGVVKDLTLYHVKCMLHGISNKICQLKCPTLRQNFVSNPQVTPTLVLWTRPLSLGVELIDWRLSVPLPPTYPLTGKGTS